MPRRGLAFLVAVALLGADLRTVFASLPPPLDGIPGRARSERVGIMLAELVPAPARGGAMDGRWAGRCKVRRA